MAFRVQLRSHENRGCVCEFGPHAHPVMRGMNASDFFRSRQTARYPESFCSSFAAHVQVPEQERPNIGHV